MVKRLRYFPAFPVTQVDICGLASHCSSARCRRFPPVPTARPDFFSSTLLCENSVLPGLASNRDCSAQREILSEKRAIFALTTLALALVLTPAPARASEIDYLNLALPLVGDHTLHVLAPTTLELKRINSKPPGAAPVDSWNFVDVNGTFQAPAFSQFAVTVDGMPATITGIGFKRRPFYAPLFVRDLRIENSLYLQLATPVADGQVVTVTNPGALLWPATEIYSVVTTPLRYSPAIHVNQEGYVPGLPKKAMIG
ncbi:MAG: hypothetical protein CFE26_25500, partial [Verrucomicrobiales bacterium VVV1]